MEIDELVELEEASISPIEVAACLEAVSLRKPSEDLVNFHVGLGFKSNIELANYLRTTDEYQRTVASPPPALVRQSIFLGDKILSYTHHGDRIYLIHDDLDLTPFIIESGVWEPHVEKAIISAVGPGQVAIEAGANIGYHTLVMARAVGKGGAVHAFEANPHVMRLLKATMMVNSYCDFRGEGRVNLYQEAAAAAKGTLVLQLAPEHFGSGHLITDSPTSDFGSDYSLRHDVPAVRIDQKLGNLAKVDFIHFDIEGAEPIALRGAEALIDRSPGVKMILEWSAEMIGAMVPVDEAVNWLCDREFRFWRIEENASGYTELSAADMASLPRSDVYVAKRAPN